MNHIFTRIIAERVARTTLGTPTGRRPECRHERVVPKEKFKRGGPARDVRAASPAQRSGEVRVYAA
jgi:hypothetical protein